MKTAEQIFDEWSVNGRGDGMEDSHWPRVRQVLEKIPVSNGNFLEIGLGNGYALEFMATKRFSQGKCYGLDVSAEMVKSSLQRLGHLANVTIEQADFLQWQPPAEPFQVIFSMEVFYYFSDIQAGIDKAFNLLKPGGDLIVMVDFYKENENSHDWPEKVGTPMKLWSMAEYENGLRTAGFIQINQEVISGGASHDGLTLYTRGRRP